MLVSLMNTTCPLTNLMNHCTGWSNYDIVQGGRGRQVSNERKNHLKDFCQTHICAFAPKTLFACICKNPFKNTNLDLCGPFLTLSDPLDATFKVRQDGRTGKVIKRYYIDMPISIGLRGVSLFFARLYDVLCDFCVTGQKDLARRVRARIKP